MEKKDLWNKKKKKKERKKVQGQQNKAGLDRKL